MDFIKSQLESGVICGCYLEQFSIRGDVQSREELASCYAFRKQKGLFFGHESSTVTEDIHRAFDASVLGFG